MPHALYIVVQQSFGNINLEFRHHSHVVASYNYVAHLYMQNVLCLALIPSIIFKQASNTLFLTVQIITWSRCSRAAPVGTTNS